MFRVNYGNGQVSHRMRTKREALAYIEACKANKSDDATGFFVEFCDPETREWFPCKRTASKVPDDIKAMTRLELLHALDKLEPGSAWLTAATGTRTLRLCLVEARSKVVAS